jgi:hypothetical protein
MIGPDGLLLVVPTYMQSQFQFFGLKKNPKKNKLGCLKCFCRGSHTEHQWGCSKGTKRGAEKCHMKTIMCRKRVGPQGLMLFAHMMTRTIARVNKPENNN